MTIWKKKVRSPIYSLIGSYLCTALWAYAAVHGDHILILFGESRDVKPPAGSRDEFFKMAREFLPPTPISE